MKLLSKLSGAVASVVPERTRRMVFIASIVALLSQQKNVDGETIHRLNKIFTLAHSDREKVIELPMLLCTVIWEGTESAKICRDGVCELSWTSEKTEIFLRKIMPTIPTWLRYQDKQMEDDIRNLFGSGIINATHA